MELQNHILAEVCKDLGIKPETLTSKGRKAEVVQARIIVSTRLREAGFSLKKIGKVFGKDHTTIIHYLKENERRISQRDWEYLEKLQCVSTCAEMLNDFEREFLSIYDI